MKKEVKMLLGFVGAFVGFEVIMSLKGDVESEYVESVKQFVDDTVTDEEREILADAEKYESLYKGIMNREKEVVEKKVDEFKKSINYIPEKKKALKEAKERVEEFKNSINYDSEIQKIEETLKEKLDSYKSSVEYDRTIESIKDQIQEAKDEYETKKATYKIFTDEETAKELKKAAKKARNKAVEEFEKEIKEIEDKFAAVEKEATEKAQKAKQDLFDKVSDVKVKANRKAQDQIDNLDRMVATTRNAVQEGVIASRTAEDAEILDSNLTVQTNKSLVEIRLNDMKLKMLKGAKFNDKLALYLHQRNIKGWMVKGVGYIPGGIGFAMAMKWLIGYIKKVNEFAVKVEVGGVAI